MKSSERHKLQQNELADWLGKVIASIQPYQNAIIIGAIVLLAAVIGSTYFMRQSSAQAENAWTDFFATLQKGNPAELMRFAHDNAQSPAAVLATLTAGDICLSLGNKTQFINKSSAKQELSQALQLYQMVLQLSKKPMVLAQATFGLAKTYESLGQLDDAMQAYSEVSTKWPKMVYASLAAERLEDLKRPDTKKMYNKFAQFDPKPAFSKQPSAKPSFGQELPPESPIFSAGAASEEKAEKLEQKADQKQVPSDETKPLKAKSAESTPENSKPAETKAENAKAAAETKAEKTASANTSAKPTDTPPEKNR